MYRYRTSVERCDRVVVLIRDDNQRNCLSLISLDADIKLTILEMILSSVSAILQINNVGSRTFKCNIIFVKFVSANNCLPQQYTHVWLADDGHGMVG